MPRFDPDTIAALAEGRIDPERARQLEREIAGDPSATAELAAHRVALQLARTGQIPVLTTEERTRLRAVIASSLGLEHAIPAVARHTPRRIPWAPIAVAAAALVGLVAVAPLANLLSTGQDSAAATTLGAHDELTTTAAATTEADTAATADVATTGGEIPAPAELGLQGDTGTTVSEEAVRSAQDDAALERLVAAFDAKATDAVPAEPTEETVCVAEAQARFPEAALLSISLETDDGITLVVFYTVADDGSVDAAAGYDPADCSLRGTLP